MSNSSQKGLSLYLTVIIISIFLGVVLGMSVILFHQLKLIRGIGNSVIAFFAADTGIERALYDQHNCLLLTDTPNCATAYPPAPCKDDNNHDGYCDGVADSYNTGVVTLGDPRLTYEVEFITVPSDGFRSKGSFCDTKRVIEIHY